MPSWKSVPPNGPGVSLGQGRLDLGFARNGHVLRLSYIIAKIAPRIASGALGRVHALELGLAQATKIAAFRGATRPL